MAPKPLYHLFSALQICHHRGKCYSSLYKYLEANLVVVQPDFKGVIIQNYKPLGFTRIQFKESDAIILEEIKTILK